MNTKIEGIKLDSNGYKLIAYSYVTDFSGCKPQVSPCHFADYKDGVLRIFEGSETHSIEFIDKDFKRAINYLRASKFHYELYDQLGIKTY